MPVLNRETKSVFAEFQKQLKNKLFVINKDIVDKKVKVEYSSDGDFEVKLKFSGDTLLFHMHSNIFDFNAAHPIHKTKYVKAIKLNNPLFIKIDGMKGKGIILQNKPVSKNIMDEEESTGI